MVEDKVKRSAGSEVFPLVVRETSISLNATLKPDGSRQLSVNCALSYPFSS